MKEYLVTLRYRFKLGEDDLDNKAAILDYLGNQRYDNIGENHGPGEDLRPEERKLEIEDIITEEPIAGKWFHSFKEIEGKRQLCWQGQVLKIMGDFLLVQLYEWMVGAPSCQKVVSLVDTRDWDFYSSNEEMNETFERRYNR